MQLLQKVSYLEKVAVLGQILCGCFFLIAAVYFIKAKVYVLFADSLKIKEVYVKNKIKSRREKPRRIKQKNKLGNKAYSKVGIMFFVGIGSIFVCRSYCVKAAVVPQIMVCENAEVINDTGTKSPTVYLESEGWIQGTGKFAQFLFSKDNRVFVIGVEEDTFCSNIEKELFLFQISEKEYINKENSSNIIRPYEQSEFKRRDTNRAIYCRSLLFETEKNSQKIYNLYLKYINKWGMPLIGDNEQVRSYGSILSGTFKSKKLVIDKKCPEIEEIRIEGQDKKQDGIRFAKKENSQKDNNDVDNVNGEIYYNTSVKGTIDVREEYLDLDNIHIQAIPLDKKARESVRKNEAESNNDVIDISAWTHMQKEDLHQISFDFYMEGKWKFLFECADIAGNIGISKQTDQEVTESSVIIIDKSAPELSVDYKGIVNVMAEESSPDNVNKGLKSNGVKITSSRNELFVQRENEMHIRIEDINLQPEDMELKLYRIEYGLNGRMEQNKENWDEVTEKIKQESAEGEWEKSIDTIKKYSIKNLEDGHYKLIIYCKDKAGNVTTAKSGSETEKCIYDGYYESPLYTVDTMNPVITNVILNQNAVRKIGKRQYFQNVPRITIKIQEENFNKMNFSFKGKMFYANGTVMKEQWEYFKKKEESLQWKSYYKNGVRINETIIEADTEANYTLDFGVTDSAAHVSGWKKLQLTYDCHKPEITYTGVDNESGDLIFRAKTDEDIKKQNSLLFHKYQFFRYFSKRKINVSIRVKDNISGVSGINYTFVPYENPYEKQQPDIDKFSHIVGTGIEEIKDEDFGKKDLSEFSVIVSPEEENFKGYIKVYGQDFSSNISDVVKSKGAISESSQLHKEVSNISIKVPQAFFTDKERNIRYYSKTVPVQAVFEDTYAGIYKTELHAKYAKKAKAGGDDSIQIGKAMMCDGGSVVYQKVQKIMLEADKFSQSDADNPLIIDADLEDNVGHTQQGVLSERVVIDNVKPEIEAVYDQNNKTQYYSVPRKATVTIKEKNFDPNLVEWNIQGSNQKYRIGEWKSVQTDIHVCDVYFEEDGENYSLGLSVTDKAGNKSKWKERSFFTIDKTVPQIFIHLDENGKKDDQVDKSKKMKEIKGENTDTVSYFNKEQLVTFCIQEKNFDKDEVEYNINAISGKKKVNIKKPTEYQKHGDSYYSKLALKQEAKYHIQVKCTDKAGNESETVETREFVIDTTAPSVQIAGVKQNGIYEEKEIQPQVICKDHYLDKSSVDISLKRINGRNVLKREWNYERAEDENTVQVQWDNIKRTKNSDGIYYLQVKGEDRAGNKIKKDFKVIFRVNQRGADFILNHDLKKKAGEYYLKESPKIEVTEQCVKQTRSRAVILKDNEEKKIIGESNIVSSVIADKKSPRYGWYEKSYHFAKKDFEGEGDYRVTFQADTKEKELRFVVDKTPPIVHIGNLEEVIYKEKEHEFTICVMDNYAFEEMELYMETGRGILRQKKIKKIIIKPEDLDENYMVRETLTEDRRYQTVRYIARDKAGNIIDSNDNGDTKVCLITNNRIVKEYNEHKKNYMLKEIAGILGIMAVASIGGLIIFLKKRKYETKNISGNN